MILKLDVLMKKKHKMKKGRRGVSVNIKEVIFNLFSLLSQTP